jgi:hypothetical protein
MSFPISLPSIATFLTLFATNLVAQDYDLVILNGRVIDPETKLDARFLRSFDGFFRCIDVFIVMSYMVNPSYTNARARGLLTQRCEGHFLLAGTQNEARLKAVCRKRRASYVPASKSEASDQFAGLTDRNFDPAGTILPPIRVTNFPKRPPIGVMIQYDSMPQAVWLQALSGSPRR